ncbi:monovalent cation/H+ antiporter complex subunit F [Phycisphaerales bacterium AB-hyl4]|uniref:Monovalent cation/H+ antiporter complex subunit F n=1 Tax=Natronomicrosphaera hydrolytica TaxID=3242702 RepID=A0ABV4UBD0_9BACT
MNWFYLAATAWLLINVAGGMVRVLRGPTAADRMLSAQLFGTTGVAVLLLLSEAMAIGAVRDVALVLAMLAAVATIAFTQRAWGGGSASEGEES